jgi:hypothetical protein
MLFSELSIAYGRKTRSTCNFEQEIGTCQAATATPLNRAASHAAVPYCHTPRPPHDFQKRNKHFAPHISTHRLDTSFTHARTYNCLAFEKDLTGTKCPQPSQTVIWELRVSSQTTVSTNCWLKEGKEQQLCCQIPQFLPEFRRMPQHLIGVQNKQNQTQQRCRVFMVFPQSTIHYSHKYHHTWPEDGAWR